MKINKSVVVIFILILTILLIIIFVIVRKSNSGQLRENGVYKKYLPTSVPKEFKINVNPGDQ
jgi:hypothetical protein